MLLLWRVNGSLASSVPDDPIGQPFAGGNLGASSVAEDSLVASFAEGNPEDPWVVVGTSWHPVAWLASELAATLAFVLP